MADNTDYKNQKKVEKKNVYVAQTAEDIQRRKIEKLMSNPDKPVVIPEKKKEWKPSDPKDFVRFVMGSSAGAGSGEFHVYRATRRRENNRLKYIDDQAKKEEADEDYHKKQEENIARANERTAKKRAKRLKKKQKQSEMKKRKQEKTDAERPSENKDGEHNVQQSIDDTDDEET
ncbi:PRKR-interacting protein 1 homolog [Xenia sp. Carnegie-2017]|uniref:PRKR-interacting protein 1 homolog n=1 Tax=Xenia sp. Carnegie-2017 TaxID=2897299 RepID=UPI001F0440A2|nr:PRKR-interacting protein 1 homolog [Xenia sp. Carnegie-2017]